MKSIELLKNRRSVYAIDDNITVSNADIISTFQQVTELVPDAFNMKSQRVVLALGKNHKQLWDAIYEEFGGEVSREKIDSFKAGAGTVLFFYDKALIQKMEKEYADYAENFKPWALQSNGMLQINVWTALREMGLGASLQHYNPVIDARVREMFDVNPDYVLLGQMVFGNIVSHPDPKEKEDITERVKVFE